MNFNQNIIIAELNTIIWYHKTPFLAMVLINEFILELGGKVLTTVYVDKNTVIFPSGKLTFEELTTLFVLKIYLFVFNLLIHGDDYDLIHNTILN